MPTVLKLPAVESILTIHIDGRWASNEFSILFDSINRLHNFQILLEGLETAYVRQFSDFSKNTDVSRLPQFVNLRYVFMTNANILFNQLNVLEPPKMPGQIFSMDLFKGDELRVKSIKYGSKGSIDFIGLGKALEAVTALITHYFPNEEKKVDILLKRKQIEEKDQEILEKRINNLKNMGFSQAQTMSILGMESVFVNNVIDLKEKGQIIGIELNDNPEG